MSAKYQKGDTVSIKSTGETVTISRVSPGPDGNYYYYALLDGSKRRFKEADLVKYIDVDEKIEESLEEQNFLSADQFLQFAYYKKYSETSNNNIYSYQGNKIIFNPFQYKPLMKFISADSDERLLVADEVGVGKTIEAGIILDELFARQDLKPTDFILVVCPNILTQKWQMELKTKFGLDDFLIQDGKSLQFMLNEIRDKGRPTNVHSIVGEQLFRNPKYAAMLKECLEIIGEPFIRFLVVDECHHYRNPETATHKLGAELSICSDRVLMLSATPFNLKKDDLFQQLNILNPGLFSSNDLFEQLAKQVRAVNQSIALLRNYAPEKKAELLDRLSGLRPFTAQSGYIHDSFEELFKEIKESNTISISDVVKYERTLNMLNPLATSFTRTLKRDALEHRVTREVKTLEVKFTDAEKEIYDSFISVNLLRHKMRGVSERAFGLIINGLERIAASSLPALTKNIHRFMNNYEKELEEASGEERTLNSSEIATMKEVLQQQYDVLLQSIDKLDGRDSKFEAFLKLIKIIREANPDNPRIMVFSFYVGTIKYLRKKLVSEGFKVGVMYGDTPNDTPSNQKDEDGFKIIGRYDICEAFKRGQIDILLASEVGGEGLDFQFCSALINYDLPYNPMRIEQRIGRIDRMGQKADKIIVGNLCITDTIDVVINKVLMSRISEAEDLVGDLEPIITNKMIEINQLIITKGFDEEELAKRTHEIDLRIEEEKTTREEFDKERYELVNDSGFRDEFREDILKSRINPLESMRFTEAFLRNVNGCWSKRVSDSALSIHITKDIREKLKNYFHRMDLGTGGIEIKQIMGAEDDIVLNFNGDSAYENTDEIFIKPSGAWIHFMLDYIKALDSVFDNNVFFATVNDDETVSIGKYCVFIYEYQLKGFSDVKSTHYIIVNAETHEPYLPNEEQWSNLIFKLKNGKPTDTIDLDGYYEMRSIADMEAEKDLDYIRKEVVGTNEVKINSRIDALKRNSHMRIKKYENDLIGAERKEEQRLRKCIERDKDKTDKSIELLEKRKDLGSSTAFQGLLVLNVV